MFSLGEIVRWGGPPAPEKGEGIVTYTTWENACYVRWETGPEEACYHANLRRCEQHMKPMKKVTKPWGHEEIWAVTDNYVGKTLVIRAGHRLSLQHHTKKEETIRVTEGTMQLELEDGEGDIQTTVMLAGEVAHIPAGRVHRMKALTDVEVYEVSTPELDDVVRHSDDYGRSSAS